MIDSFLASAHEKSATTGHGFSHGDHLDDTPAWPSGRVRNHLFLPTTVALSFITCASVVYGGVIPGTLSESHGHARLSVAPGDGPSSVSPTEPEHRTERIDRLRQQIRAYASFEDNWDGYGGSRPDRAAIVAAERFLMKLPAGASLPRTGLSGDGEIGLFWDYGEGFIDVGFVGDGEYSYYARSSLGAELFGDNQKIDEDINEELVQFIRDYA